ncbi:MAG: protein kinase [Pirellulaceae bacterium]|nr:MAG: protein kinase [Pirellulaceae bacterium]
MARSKVGPFLLETPLGSGPGSSTYRALHVQQRKLAALRVFSLPMGMTPESRRDFAAELEELKSLLHPHIVRCYGGGFDRRRAFLAYELVEGESLESLVARRERLPWETAFDFSEQIVKALEYAHQRRWIHGRLSPRQVLVDATGVVKVTGWRRGVVAATVRSKDRQDDRIFNAPEVNRGEPPTEKSDLYSLGVLTFYMLSGRLPYESVEEQQAAAERQDKPPRVSPHVIDCPVWLDAAVAQLLEPHPNARPFSAAAVLLAFREAKRRQAEGAGVLQHVASGFSPLQVKADRQEAERLLGIDKERKRSQRRDFGPPLWERPWFLAIVLLLAVAVVVWALLPPSESTLRARAVRLLPPESEEWTDWNAARDRYLTQILERFPEGEHATWAREQIAWINAREAERRLERDARRNRTADWTDAETQFWQARQLEQFEDRQSALLAYQALVRLYGDVDQAQDLVYLAREAIQRLRSGSAEDKPVWEFLEAKLQQAEEAYRQARLLEARQIWEAIIQLYDGREDVGPLVEQAKARIAELAPRR